ncbi:hypothetical protein, partial [Streptomyces sp. SolWspMP-sol7th]|uniref:hypothetical protein n=1 Tax=Streptomyces sp. SolWspMP-sol7th TaxID=1839776 RepID=UPI001586915B
MDRVPVVVERRDRVAGQELDPAFERGAQRGEEVTAPDPERVVRAPYRLAHLARRVQARRQPPPDVRGAQGGEQAHA